MNLLGVLFSALLVLFSFFNLGNNFYQNIRLNVNVVRPLELASTFQDPKDMEQYFHQAVDFIEDHNLDKGNTCLLFSTTPQCELSNFHKKLEQDIEILEEIRDEPISSYTTTNALNRIHQSLYKAGSEGREHIDLPDYNFALRWGVNLKPITKLIEWFSGIVAVVLFLFFAAAAS